MVERLYSTADVARILGVSARRVRQLIAWCGVGRKIGRDWVLTDQELDRLRPGNRKRRHE